MTEREVFTAALAKADPGERASYLAAACAGDPPLRQRVELLLADHGELGSFMLDSGSAATEDLSSATVSVEQTLSERPGCKIGPYKLLQQIGEGGFGIVFMAEQQEPVRRRVALKVIKPGMDSRQVIARFEAERQALAVMDHPHIATVLDAGATDSGRPYFVMELVRGVPITHFCDENSLTIRERLSLLVTVCQAIQHAHTKGIIHRDIKPSNVLVTRQDGEPIVKVIDFGIAKAVGQQLTEKTLFTEFAQLVGTPLYMSPEQAELSSTDIDTRSDIYSLGVLLYELLTGTTPVSKQQLKQAGFDEIRRIIREDEPPKPSTRISSAETAPNIAAQRHTNPAGLARLIRGELDWIVMKCLEKDRTRRYETASSLAADVQRFLRDEPIEACAASYAYRLAKYLKRNRVQVAIASLLTAVAMVTVVFSLVAYHQQLRQRELSVAAEQAKTQRTLAQWTREVTLPEIARLLDAEQPVAALQILREAKENLPKDPEMAALESRLLARADVSTSPAAASAWVQDWQNPGESWLPMGQTPLREVPLPRGRVRWRFTRDGYAPRELVADAADLIATDLELLPAAEVPDGMVYIPAAPRTGKRPPLGRFLIDRYEVSNLDYQKFVDAGGYQQQQFWKHEFRDQYGKVHSWAEAMRQFVDVSGRPGPAAWSGGRFPAGQPAYPVRGINWYEAAAYAEFAGKSLPTTYHWERVAGLPQAANTTYIVSLSNFSGSVSPVGRNRGIGAFEVYDLAGNVREWCSTATAQGRRLLRGGACDAPPYMFEYADAADPLDRSLLSGVRCVRYLDAPAAETLGLAPVVVRDFARETPAGSSEIEGYRRLFVYDRSLPLNPERLSAQDESDTLRHEIIRIAAAYHDEQFTIHMLLPRNSAGPHKTLLYFPGTGILQYREFDKIRTHPDWVLAVELVERGWAVCWPTLQGSFERNLGSWPPNTSLPWRDRMIQVVQDLSRSVDYLETRDDIDRGHLGYIGFSWGAANGPLLLVLDQRYRFGVLVSGGHRPNPILPEVEAFNYCPHVKQPLLMINGRADEAIQSDALQLPFFQHLGSQDKTFIQMDAGHLLPWKEAVDQIDDWATPRLENLGASEP